MTPCSALSQASCRSPDDQRGAGLLTEEVGAHVGIIICEKSPSEATVAMKADKCQQEAAGEAVERSLVRAPGAGSLQDRTQHRQGSTPKHQFSPVEWDDCPLYQAGAVCIPLVPGGGQYRLERGTR